MAPPSFEAVGIIRELSNRSTQQPLAASRLDGMLYLLSRNPRLMASPRMKPPMRVATMAF